MKWNEMSILESELNLKGDKEVKLSAKEREILCEALTKCAKMEVDLLPIIELMDKLVKA